MAQIFIPLSFSKFAANAGITPVIAPKRINHPSRMALEALFRAHFSDMMNLAAENVNLTPAQPSSIVEFVAEQLDSYPVQCDDDKPSDADFMVWARSIIVPKRQLAALRTYYQRFVWSGVWRMLKSYTDMIDDKTLQEVSHMTWCWIHRKQESLLALDQPALISTRLSAGAYFAARTYITLRMRANGYKPKYKPAAQRRAEVEAKQFAIAIAPEGIAVVLTRKRSKASDPTSDHGKPAVGAKLLCSECLSPQRVQTVHGYSAVLACGHYRTAELPAIAA